MSEIRMVLKEARKAKGKCENCQLKNEPFKKTCYLCPVRRLKVENNRKLHAGSP